jgi:uncharacterized protein (TIGR02598 family)
MHQDPSFPSAVRPPKSAESGFSLVEITIAIGIIAFAFVALIGVLPVGLNTYRNAIDTANESWIVQGLSSMVQVTTWDKVVNDLSFEKGGNIYYFDEEGRLTDTHKKPSTDPEVLVSRLYAAKLIVEPLYQPDASKSTATTNKISGARRVIAVISKISNPQAMKQFDTITDIQSLIDAEPRNQDVHVRAFIAAQMESR